MMSSYDTPKHHSNNNKENAHNRNFEQLSSWKRSKVEEATNTVWTDATATQDTATCGGDGSSSSSNVVVSFRWPYDQNNSSTPRSHDWCFPPVIHWNSLTTATTSQCRKKPTQQRRRLGAALVETGCPRLEHFVIVPRNSMSNQEDGTDSTIYHAIVDIPKHHHYQSRANQNSSSLPVLGDRAEIWGHKLAAKTAVRLQVRCQTLLRSFHFLNQKRFVCSTGRNT
jgi:hypothetical protein